MRSPSLLSNGRARPIRMLSSTGRAWAMAAPRVLRAIAGGSTHAIAITFMEGSGASDQNVVVDWTVVRDEEAAGGIAATMLAAPPSLLGRTSIKIGRAPVRT